MPFCSDNFILHWAVRAVLWCFALRYWTACTRQGSFQILQEISAVRLLSILLNELTIALKVLSGGLKPVLHEDLHYSLSWRGISSFFFFPRELFCLNGTSHFYLLAVSFFSHAEGLFEMGYNLCTSFISAGFRPACYRLNTLMSVAMRNRFKV